MARINNLTNFLTDVATAIKTKKGSEASIPATNFDTEILALPSQGVYEQRVLNISANGSQTITPGAGFDAIDELTLTVAVPEKQLQSKTYNFTQNTNIELLPDTGYDGFDSVTLNINVPAQQINNQDKTITQNGVYTADSGYTGLGEVTVNVSGGSGSGDVKLFETAEEMQADPDAEKEDLAIIYREETQPVTENSRFSSCIFPNTVVLDEPYTDGMYGYFYNTDEKGPYFVGEIGLYYDEFKFDTEEGDTNIHISYTSEDGITYIRTDGGEKLQEFGTPIMWGPEQSYAFNSTIGNFMKIGGDCFHGLYIGTGNASGNKYKLADTQFTAVANVVYNETFYSKNGVETGTLTTNISNTFDDTNAEVYAKIQQQYNNMIPRVLTDEDKTIDTNIKIIPSKSDGTSLFDTSNVTDMDGMFEDCVNLIFISNLDTSNVTVMSWMFEDCVNLTSIPLLDTSNVTDMDGMLYGCTSLTTIPLLNTSNVTSMSSMFEECTSLTTIPLLNTSNVTSMNGMFEDCTSLTTIPLLDTSNVISIRSMFVRCTSLTSIPSLDTGSVDSMSSMFEGCTSLTTIPLLNTSNVTSMNGMFEDCTSLTTIPLLNTSNVTDVRYMFEDCTSLTTIPLLDTSNVTDIEYMFRNCTSLNNESLNNILVMCTNATKITSNKTLARIGLTQEQATTCQGLSNYQAFVNAGWTTGY